MLSVGMAGLLGCRQRQAWGLVLPKAGALRRFSSRRCYLLLLLLLLLLVVVAVVIVMLVSYQIIHIGNCKRRIAHVNFYRRSLRVTHI